MPEQEIGSSGTVTIPEVKQMQKAFELDLIAYFTELQSESLNLIDQAQEEGWTIAKLVSEVQNLTK